MTLLDSPHSTPCHAMLLLLHGTLGNCTRGARSSGRLYRPSSETSSDTQCDRPNGNPPLLGVRQSVDSYRPIIQVQRIPEVDVEVLHASSPSSRNTRSSN